ncbi:hypothetical protein Y032_0002g1089 [Ancylostoma ceylanicum]|uniref:TIL domain-containing protein n=1 Tax=Ancylostoma ceylanicum TaxID=53326 RepID=A0A016W0F3_9BILA|nr:hypothetical protein Y032_0002g1089 [Ancylostoma ceylanicum]
MDRRQHDVDVGIGRIRRRSEILHRTGRRTAWNHRPLLSGIGRRSGGLQVDGRAEVTERTHVKERAVFMHFRPVGVVSQPYACPNPRPIYQDPPIIIIPPYPYPPTNSYPPARIVSDYIPPYRPYPGQQIPYYTCPAYQTYAQCVPCERACNTQYYLCYPYCVTGCTCQSGYVRDTATNNCISSYYCPRLYQGYNRYAVYGQSQDVARK